MTDKTTTDATDTETTAAPAVASSLTDAEREAIAQMPYEEARDKLIQAVQALEAGGLNLDQSMRQWEIGEALARRAQDAPRRGARQARRRPGRAGRLGADRWYSVQPGLSPLTSPTGSPPDCPPHGSAQSNLD